MCGRDYIGGHELGTTRRLKPGWQGGWPLLDKTQLSLLVRSQF